MYQKVLDGCSESMQHALDMDICFSRSMLIGIFIELYLSVEACHNEPYPTDASAFASVRRSSYDF